jgi:YesN/AraC family two-component response regulator
VKETADHTISILIVEDEVAALELLAKIVPKKFPGVTLYTATDGRAALELFQAHKSDIVITDINMPKMNGVQLIAEIRAVRPDVQIIVLTGDTGKASLEASIGNGFEIDYYIVKPVDFGLLFAGIAECLGKTMRTSISL